MSAPPGSPRGDRARRLAPLLVLLSIGVGVYLLTDAWTQFIESARAIEWWRLGAGWVVATLSALTSLIVFALLLNRPAFGWRSLGHLFFAAQLMKHMPGRIWGVGYQAALVRGSVRLSDLIAVNLVHSVLSLAFAVIVSLAVVLFDRWPVGAAFALAGGCATVVTCWNARLAGWAVQRVPRVGERVVAAIKSAIDTTLRIRIEDRLRTTAVFLLGWAMYFAAWSLYGESYPEVSAGDGVRIAALYTLAWAAGYLSLVTSSGIGVREAVFAALAHSYPDHVVLYFALLGRLSLLGTDIALGLTFFRPPHDRTLA